MILTETHFEMVVFVAGARGEFVDGRGDLPAKEEPFDVVSESLLHISAF